MIYDAFDMNRVLSGYNEKNQEDYAKEIGEDKFRKPGEETFYMVTGNLCAEDFTSYEWSCKDEVSLATIESVFGGDFLLDN